MNLGLRFIIGVLSFLLLITLVLIGKIPDAHYADTVFYDRMTDRLDSLEDNWHPNASGGLLKVGWSKVSLTPNRSMPLAGYGNRSPKTFEGIGDSIFVRTIVFEEGDQRAAWLSVDLLVVHPTVSERFFSLIEDIGWRRDEIYFSATHTHSGIGAWAPGFIGNLFAGPYEEQAVMDLADRLVTSLKLAESRIDEGQVSYNELQVPELVKNRLVRDRGITDPWLKILGVRTGDIQGYVSVYSAHATSFGRRYRSISGDFPGYYNDLVEADTEANFSMYAAGAVGSMGPRIPSAPTEEVETRVFAKRLSENIELLELLSPAYVGEVSVMSFRLPLELPRPMLKINNSHGLRPWLFEYLAGRFGQEVSVLVLGDVVMIGLPCDFSGELAMPLYDLARDLGLHLILTSFNGGYTGYVIKDEWYGENSYESRVMSWYGPNMGTYYSETITRLLQIISAKKVEG